MTKSTITREQLEEWVAQFDEDGGCDATDRQLEALIRQSLASMLQTEPVTTPSKLPGVIDDNLVEGLRLLQCMLDDYRERNYGHAQDWVRHIDQRFSEHSEAHGDDAYCILHGLLAGEGDSNSPAQSDCCPTQNHVFPEQNGDTPAQSQGWIPVSERMPESNGVYFGWDGKRVLEVNCFFGGFSANQFIHGEITHWMPLPAPPTEVK